MKLLHRLKVTRPLQVGFLILLGVCSAQLAYWMLDEARYTADVRARLRSAYEAVGKPVAPEILARLDAERFHRLNRYAWEGAFFLAVLVAAMAVVYQALRDEAELRHRQESFLADVSHELKSPLASLRLSVETLSLRDPPAARRSELVHRLLGDLARLERMIANILDTSRVAAASIRTSPERLVLAEEVAAVFDEVREHATEHQARLRADVPAELLISADPEGVRTVLRNLVHNAIKATAGGGEVAVSAANEDGRVRLEVRDDGVGFPPHEAGRVFEKFYRIEGDGRSRSSGTGLGLYLVWRFVQLDGGSVRAESPGPGQGATFTVSWPVAKGGAA
ncbi:MAG: sensor histidine kinase [Gemmatimonadales bacterium]